MRHQLGFRDYSVVDAARSNLEYLADKGTREYANNVKEDYKIRQFLRKKLKAASLSRVEIDRKAQRLIVRIITGRPGMVVGRGGQGLDMLRKDLNALTGRKDIQLDVVEVARIDAEAQLVAESIAQQLEKRVAFRRAMKQAIQRASRSGVKGIKVMVSGRLGGAEIARTEWAKEGRIPLHTFRADIDYGFAEAKTNYGVIGIKVWVYKGEVVPKGDAQAAAAAAAAAPAQPSEAPAEPKRAKKPAPRAGAKRGPARPRPEGDRKAAAPKVTTTVKKPRKVVKDAGTDKKE